MSTKSSGLPVLFVLITAVALDARPLGSWGLLAGVSGSDLGSRPATGWTPRATFLVGPQGGAFIVLAGGTLGAEVQYVERGISEGETDVVDQYGNLIGRYQVEARFAYLSAPILLRKAVHQGGVSPHLGAGIAPSLLVAENVSEYSILRSQSGDAFGRFNLSWLVELGVGFPIGRVVLTPIIRYESSVLNISTLPDISASPRALQLLLALGL